MRVQGPGSRVQGSRNPGDEGSGSRVQGPRPDGEDLVVLRDHPEAPPNLLKLLAAFFSTSFLEHSCGAHFFAQGRPNGAKVDPKVDPNGSQSCSRGSSARNFVISLILMPLPCRIAIFMVSE